MRPVGKGEEYRKALDRKQAEGGSEVGFSKDCNTTIISVFKGRMKITPKKLQDNTIFTKQRGRNGNHMNLHRRTGAPDGSAVKNPPANAGDVSSIHGSGRSLEKKMATHSSILAWEIPWTEEWSGLRSTGLQASWTEPQQQ